MTECAQVGWIVASTLGQRFDMVHVLRLLAITIGAQWMRLQESIANLFPLSAIAARCS